MTITVCGDRIEFGANTLCSTTPGFSFNACIRANDIIDRRSFGRSTTGFVIGGAQVGSKHDTIQTFPFASDSNSTDVGEVTTPRASDGGEQAGVSDTAAYLFGGDQGDVQPVPGQPLPACQILKVVFASCGSCRTVGNQPSCFGNAANATDFINQAAFSAGGDRPGPTFSTNILCYPFAAESPASNVGSLATPNSAGIATGAAASSTTAGYVQGGVQASPSVNLSDIYKYNFASTSPATDVGNICFNKREMSGGSSPTHGYNIAGEASPNPSPDTFRCAQKFPFASDGNTTFVGSLASPNDIGRSKPSGISSKTNVYTVGGNSPGPTCTCLMDRFPFASDTVSTHIGCLVCGSGGGSGSQAD